MQQRQNLWKNKDDLVAIFGVADGKDNSASILRCNTESFYSDHVGLVVLSEGTAETGGVGTRTLYEGTFQ